MVELAEGSTTAALFTQNSFAAPPVVLAQKHIISAQTRALLVNAGNANAATGAQGLNNAMACCSKVSELIGCECEQVLPFSTGVIGEPFDMPAMLAGIQNAVAQVGQADWLGAARAIMTTDTVPKAISRTVEIDGEVITVTGIAKGSGMISPNMATMLAFVVTDAPLATEVLQSLVETGNARSFNCITVDSDTSTNDALVLSATGRANIAPLLELADPRTHNFELTLNEVLSHLATSIIRDAEGATKFISIEVVNGLVKPDCVAVAYAVANSPLVKTALFAGDPNWGRLVMAIGKAKTIAMDVSLININVNSVALLTGGQLSPSYSEELGQRVFSQDEIEIQIDLAQGDESHRVWTSDLSHDYVSINADYRS